MSEGRRLLEPVLHRALSRLSLLDLVRASLESRPVDADRVRVISAGKAAAAMAHGALEALRPAVDRLLLVVPDGAETRPLVAEARRRGVSCDVHHASHPLPDARSTRAARACVALVREPGPEPILLLISGGASSLLSWPIAGVKLATKRAVIAALLAAGAPIREINVVRKHLSRIKGGGLAREARPRRVVSLVVSDVLRGGAADVGSGPGIPDGSTKDDARAVLARYAPRFADLPLRKPWPGRLPSDRGTARVLASPARLVRAACEELEARGYRARALTPSVNEARALARSYARLAETLAPGEAFVRAAEPRVVVPNAAGAGGRNTHLAALVAASLPRGVVFLAAATDGVDAASGTAGACVTAELARRARRVLGPDALERAIQRFDTGPLHLALGTALPGGPTGHNFADLHVLVRVKKPARSLAVARPRRRAHRS